MSGEGGAHRSTPRHRRLGTPLALILLLTSIGQGLAVGATQVGHRGHSFDGFGAGAEITGQKPESKVWYHANSWWAAMLSPALAGAHTIHRLDGTVWIDTGTVIDPRPATREDVLSNGSTLYVLSRSPATAGANALRRFTATPSGYTLDAGFPVDVPGSGSESTTIARDSTGTLWLTYEDQLKVFVARTTGDDRTWGAPYVLPFAAAQNLNSDDISSVVSFTDSTGPAVGVMWSHQNDSNQYFAVHRDGGGDTAGAWTLETALSGPNEADDHINLKTFEGRVYAVVKTSATESAQPLIRLLERSATGTWTKHPVARVDENNTRPVTLLSIDPVNRQIYVFMTMGVGAGARGIAYKASPMNGIGFPAQATTFIQGPNLEAIDNATTTKQNVDSTSGLVILASDPTQYWHNKLGGDGGPVVTPSPTPVVTPSPPPVSGAVAFRSASYAANTSTSSLVIPRPNSVAAGDLLLASIDVRGKPAITAPAGWNLVRMDTNANALRKATYARIAGAGEPAASTWTFSAAFGAAGGIHAYSGVDIAAPIAVHGGRTNAKATAITAPSVIAPEANGLLVGFFATAAATGVAPPTQFVERGEASSTSGPYMITSEGADRTLTSAGATGTVTATAGISAANIAHVIVVRPAGAGTAPSPTPVVTPTPTPPTGAAITFRAASYASNASTSSLIVPRPDPVAAGDVLLASVDVRGSRTIATPAGWNAVRVDANGTAMRKGTYYRVATADEPSGYLWTFSGSSAASGGIHAYSGVDPTAPIDVHSGQANTSTTLITAPSVTPSVANGMLVGLFGIATVTTIAPPATFTERGEASGTVGQYTITGEGADRLLDTENPTGPRWASAGSNWPSIGQLVVLRPGSVQAGPGASPGQASFAPFGTRTLAPNWDLDGAGTNVDSIAFWEAPNPADSLMLVTAKGNQLVEVWRYPFGGSELPPLTHPSFASDSQVNGIVVDQQNDRLYVAVGSPKSIVVVFSLPSLTYVDEYIRGSVDLSSEPNLALLPSSSGGTLYVTASTRVHLHNAATGGPMGTFAPAKGLETIAADAYYQALYIPDENGATGVYAYTPDGNPDVRTGDSVFGGTAFGSDAEGIVIYTCPATGGSDDGRGLIVVSDQLPDLTEFEVFDRQTRAHLGNLRLAGVSNTDGVGSTQRPLPGYPLGVFAAVNDDRSVAGIGWDSVLTATGISCGG